MLGCMVEAGLGISAACAVASLFDHVDLDGNLLLADDPWRGVELEDGVQMPSHSPGLGVTRREGGLRSWPKASRPTPTTGRRAAASVVTAATRGRDPRLERAGETDEGVPVVATVEEALRLGPTTAVIGVATQGGRFPPAWRALRSCVDGGPRSRTGCTCSWPTTPT